MKSPVEDEVINHSAVVTVSLWMRRVRFTLLRQTQRSELSDYFATIAPTTLVYRAAQKVSHYQESSLNRIKNRQRGYTYHHFWVYNEHRNVVKFVLNILSLT